MRLAVRFTLSIAATVLLSCAVTTSLAADGIDDKVDSALRKELLNKLAAALEAKYVVPETADEACGAGARETKGQCLQGHHFTDGPCASADR